MSFGPWAEGDTLSPTNLNNRGGGPFSATSLVNVSWSMFSTSRNTTSIQSAINYASTNNIAGIVIPQSYLPYDTSTISDIYSVHRFCEGGPSDSGIYDVRAYGAGGVGSDDWAGEQAAYDVAGANSAAGKSKVVYYGPGVFTVSKPVSAFKCSFYGVNPYRADDYGASTYLNASYVGGPRIILQDRTQSLPLVSALATGTGSAISITANGKWFNLRDCKQADLNGATALSIECYYKSSGTPGLGVIVSSRGKLLNSDSVGHAFDLRVDTPQAKFTINTSVTGTVTISGGTITDGVTHFLEASWEGTTARLFVDGALVASAVASGTLVQGLDEAVTIGYDFSVPEGTGFLGNPSGTLDSIRVSNTARHTAAYTAPTAKLTNDANTLFLLNFDNQLGYATRAQSKDGNLWLVFRDTTAGGGAGGTRMSFRDLSFDGGGTSIGIFMVPQTYHWSGERLDFRNMRSAILAPTENAYDWRLRDVYAYGAVGVGRYGMFMCPTAALGTLDSSWFQTFQYPLVFQGTSSKVHRVFFQSDSRTVINLVATNMGSAGGPIHVDECVFNTEGGVSTDYRAALAFGGQLRTNGAKVTACVLETGNNAPFVIGDTVDVGSFDCCNFIRSGSPTEIMHTQGTIRRPVEFSQCDQSADASGFLPWSLTTGAAVVARVGPLSSTSTGGTVTFNGNVADIWDLTFTSDVTVSNWTRLTYGQPLEGTLKMDSTGSRLFVWPTNSKGTVTLSYGSAAVNTFSGFYDGVNVILTSVRTGL